MITVSILINGQPLFTRSAVNIRTVQTLRRGEECRYELDDGTLLTHIRQDGAVKLAKAMLDTIKEPGVNRDEHTG